MEQRQEQREERAPGELTAARRYPQSQDAGGTAQLSTPPSVERRLKGVNGTLLAMVVRRSRNRPTIQTKLVAASTRSVRSMRYASFLSAGCMLAARWSIADRAWGVKALADAIVVREVVGTEGGTFRR